MVGLRKYHFGRKEPRTWRYHCRARRLGMLASPPNWPDGPEGQTIESLQMSDKVMSGIAPW
jgi:hypothetical protein